MISQARLASIGVGQCTCVSGGPIPATGFIISVSPDTMSAVMGNATIASLMVSPCGVGVLLPSINNVSIDNISPVTVGTQFVGCFTGFVISGTPSVQIQ